MLCAVVAGDSSAAGAELRKACQLNLASCYLNTGRTQTVVQLCTDVLAAEPGNRKVLPLSCRTTLLLTLQAFTNACTQWRITYMQQATWETWRVKTVRVLTVSSKRFAEKVHVCYLAGAVSPRAGVRGAG